MDCSHNISIVREVTGEELPGFQLPITSEEMRAVATRALVVGMSGACSLYTWCSLVAKASEDKLIDAYTVEV